MSSQIREQVAQRCEVSIPSDIQNLTGHDPEQTAQPDTVLGRQVGLEITRVPSNHNDSLF